MSFSGAQPWGKQTTLFFQDTGSTKNKCYPIQGNTETLEPAVHIVFRLLTILGLILTLTACNSSDNIHGNRWSAPGVSDTEIRLGSSLALTGHAGYLGTQTLRGAEAYLRHINDLGGIFGRKYT